ncbi:hypothetical protein J5N97_025421 [Dioscorea zingiberensis]|uniref:Cytochrome P450 n=1 Tax=Dioscorea zingiberensis TaxID=325984 RepID=A0A9D5C989_9LILI|nr:hypothetical protein J5N97_025421 [Dioscorea zingiberensis]
MAEMIGKPETMRKAQEELDSVVGKEEIVDESHIGKLPYLEALVKETLRLHPPVPLLLPRYPTTTCNIGGYIIPKGTKVFINVWSIHRDPAVWENPLEFKPERFLSGMSKLDYYGNNFNFIPFGSGRRICVGITLVEKMSLYILATMLHCFDWSSPDGTKLDLVEKFGIVLKKEKQLVVIPTARPSCAKLREFEYKRTAETNRTVLSVYICYSDMSEVSHAWSWYQNEESQRMALTFFFILSTIIFILYLKSEMTKGVPGLPPGPRGLPLVGYLPFLRSDLHSCFADLARIFGPVMMIKLGSRQCLILSSPEAAKEVLRDHDATFANHDMTVAGSIITFGGQDMVFQPYGPLWRALRKASVRELLNARTLDSFRTLRQQEVTLMAKELQRRAGMPVAVGQMVFVTSFNVITAMLWGNWLVAAKLERIRVEFREVVVGIVDLLGVTNVSDIFPILERMDLQGVQHKEKLDGVLSTVIDQRERTVNTHGDQEKAQDFLRVGEEGRSP